MINAEELLKPLSDENPCGEDLSYDPSFQELETLMRGKPETQFSAAEPPDWKVVQKHCISLFNRAKDLRVATALCVAALQTDGLPALREGLVLLKGLLEKYWEPVHPRLDPDDNNDPTIRVNIIAALSTPKGTFGDPLQFLDRVNEAPLANSMQIGRVTYGDILKMHAGLLKEDGTPVVSSAHVEAAFRDTSPEYLQVAFNSVSDALGALQDVDNLLTNVLGNGNAPDLGLALAEFKDIRKVLGAYLPNGTGVQEVAVDGAPAGSPGLGVGAAVVTGQRISGEVQSRQDVLVMLDKICDYYAKAEPTSPVPNLLRRARRMADMDFMQIINDMCPDAVSQVRIITGERAE